MSKTYTVDELSLQWNVSGAWIRNRINRGQLLAKNLSPGSKRATWRIDSKDAETFWESLSTKTEKVKPRRVKPIQSTESSFDDFI